MAILDRKTLTLTALLSIMLGFSGSVLAGDYEGSWILDDTSGKPFEAILNADGTASGTHGNAMKYGTWKEENGAAVIHWKTGWTTVISKKGDKFFKAAYKPGIPLTDTPTNTSDAKKKE